MADVIVTPGTPINAQHFMSGTDTLTVQALSQVSTTDDPSILFNAATTSAQITNSGTIENTQGNERAIRLGSSVGNGLAVTITNNAGGTITSGGDAIQIQASAGTAGSLTISNSGTIEATGTGQALDFGTATGAVTANITNSNIIRAAAADAVQIASTGIFINSGSIDGGSNVLAYSGADGIQFEPNASGSVTNNTLTGAISGDRHAINVGDNTGITVTNNLGALIMGRNGSGVGSDDVTKVTTVVNFGTITGAFSNSAGSDEHGSTIGQPDGGGADGTNDGDGDGIDIDGQATITNDGTIQGTGAGGTGSDGRPNTSEGIAAGGGTITNTLNGLITGLGLGILIDDSSTGNAPFVTTVVNDGIISGTSLTGIGIRIISNLADTITNNGSIAGGANGSAIQFGSGNNTLKVGAGSAITGLSNGGAGTNTLDYSTFGAAGVTVNLAAGTAPSTGGVTNFQNVIGSAGGDTLFGRGGANDLNGGGGDDRLYGDGGDDTTTGGPGDDWHFVDDPGDTVNDANAEGTLDRVFASTSYVLTAGAYIERFSTNDHAGTVAINLTGNELANIAYGNAGGNLLSGAGENDTLVGLGGVDTLQGDAGNDTLIGGDGSDILEGGGDDDRLYGQAGTNQLTGGTGNDWYFVDSAIDVINEALNEGTLDRVFTSVSYVLTAGAYVENFSTNNHGGSGAISLTGNELGNLIYGNAGNNVINGMTGNDTLVGLGGQDSFQFTTALNPVTNVDRIADFSVADDTIVLDHAFVFAGPGPGPLTAPEFGLGASPTSATQRILYDPATGALRYDADGAAGGEVLFATMSPGLGVTAADFFMI